MKVFAFGGIFNPFGNDVEEIFSQNEWHSFTVDAKLLFEVAQEMSEVDVKDVAILVDHDIIGIAIADAQYKSGHAITSTRVSERFNCLFIPKPLFIRLFLNVQILIANLRKCGSYFGPLFFSLIHLCNWVEST